MGLAFCFRVRRAGPAGCPCPKKKCTGRARRMPSHGHEALSGEQGRGQRGKSRSSLAGAHRKARREFFAHFN
eukprot:9483077-Pyramimonas_sp.AAC.1